MLTLGTMWRCALLGGMCLLSLGAAGGRSHGKRTATGEVHGRTLAGAQAKRSLADSLPFTSCRDPLTAAEHDVLDDNTHEVMPRRVHRVWLTGRTSVCRSRHLIVLIFLLCFALLDIRNKWKAFCVVGQTVLTV